MGTSADYERFEDWFAGKIDESAFIDEVGELEEEKITDSVIMDGIENVFRTVKVIEDGRISDEGSTIMKYFQNVIKSPRGKARTLKLDTELRKRRIFTEAGTDVTLGAFLDKEIDIREERRKTRRQREELGRILKEYAGQPEDIIKAELITAGVSDNIIRDARERIKKASEIDITKRLEKEQKEREAVLMPRFFNIIENTTKARELDERLKKNILREIKNPNNQSRVLIKFYEKKEELAPGLTQTETRRALERITVDKSEIPEGKTESEVRTDNAEQYFLEQIDELGFTTKDPLQYSKNMLLGIGLSAPEIELLKNKHRNIPLKKKADAERKRKERERIKQAESLE